MEGSRPTGSARVLGLFAVLIFMAGGLVGAMWLIRRAPAATAPAPSEEEQAPAAEPQLPAPPPMENPVVIRFLYDGTSTTTWISLKPERVADLSRYAEVRVVIASPKMDATLDPLDEGQRKRRVFRGAKMMRIERMDIEVYGVDSAGNETPVFIQKQD